MVEQAGERERIRDPVAFIAVRFEKTVRSRNVARRKPQPDALVISNALALMLRQSEVFRYALAAEQSQHKRVSVAQNHLKKLLKPQ